MKKRTLIAAIVAIFAAVAMIVAAAIGFGGGEESAAEIAPLYTGKNYALYYKDGDLIYTEFDGEKLVLAEDIFGKEEWQFGSSGAGSTGWYTAFNEDGSRLFYPARNSGGSVVLCYRDLDEPASEPVEVDSNIFSFAIDTSGEKIVYYRFSDAGADNGGLYISDLETKQRIATSIDRDEIYFTDDLSRVAYMTSGSHSWRAEPGNQTLGVWQNGEVELLSTEVARLFYVSDELDLFCYIEGYDDLYLHRPGSERELIAGDAYDVLAAYDSGEIYYTKETIVERPLTDFVVDDCADEDAQSTDYSASLRNAIRAEIDQVTLQLVHVELWLYKDGESTLISDELNMSSSAYESPYGPMLLVYIYPEEEPRYKFSELGVVQENGYICGDIETLTKRVSNALWQGAPFALVCGDEIADYDGDSDRSYFSPAGDAVYYIVKDEDDELGRNCGELYKVPIKNGRIGKPELYDEEVDNFYGYLEFVGNEPIYRKYVGEEKEIFLAREQVGSGGNTIDVADDSFYYFTDYAGGSAERYGTVNLYRDGESIAIADNVQIFVYVTPAGDLLYLRKSDDPSSEHDDLWFFDGEKSVLVDSGVEEVPYFTKFDRLKGGKNYF